MRRSLVALVPLAVLIAACTSDRTTSPRAITAGAGSNISLPSCDINTAKSDARNFFARGNDAVYGALSNAAKSPALSAARDGYLWDALAEEAKARLTGRQVTPFSSSAAAGEAFAKDVFGCMRPETVGDVSSITGGLLATALLQGVFEVPGRSIGGTVPAAAYLATGSSTADFPSTKWGAQPNGSWPTGDYLVFGYPTNLGGIYLQTGASINTSFNAFELQTIPLSRSEPWNVTNVPTVGACVLTNATAGVTNRLFHGLAVQANVSPNALCTLGSRPGIAMTPSQQFFASLSSAIQSVFVPKPAYAMFDDEYSGGGPTSWSPNLIGQLGNNAVHLSWVQQPQDGTVGATQTIRVKAEYDGSDLALHPLGGPGVIVTLSIVGNNGTPGQIVPNTASPDAVTGVAEFNSYFTKAGGYYIQASVNIAGSVITSQQFWIRGQ